MTIVVQCPYCETKSNVAPDMMGKTMRCPNLQCRMVFPIKEQPLEIEPPPLPPEPEPEEAATPATARRKKPGKPARPKPAKPGVVDARVVDAAVVQPPKVKEVVWSEGAGVPPPPGGRKPPRPPARGKKPPPFKPIRRRKKRKNVAPLILIGIIVLIVLIGGSAFFYLLHVKDVGEQQAWDKAKQEFEKGDYTAAKTSYESLTKEYPESEHSADYQFFTQLCDMEVVVRGVTVKEAPEAALQKLQTFVKETDGSPFVKTTSGGYGREVFEAGKKLGEDIVAHAAERVKAFQSDRSGKAGELAKAEKTIAMGRDLLKLMERFRGDELPLDKIRAGLDQSEADVKRERDRTAAIAKAAGQLDPLSDAAIQLAEADLAASGFLEDSEAQTLLAEAKGKLRDMVKFVEDPVGPIQSPTGSAASLLFVTPIGKTTAPPAGEGGSSVFLAVARGILYAIEEKTGSMLWAVRVGQEVVDPPVVARLETDEGISELALVTSIVNGQPALAAYMLRTGQPRWYQPLTVRGADGTTFVPVAAAGSAVVVGGRAFLAVRDGLGTIYEFDLASGLRKGYIRLGQPVGPGLVLRPGTGFIYAAAEARRIYVMDVKDDAGNLKPAQCVQVIATGHPPGALRTPPLLVGPAGDQPADRWMLLSQSDGPTSMNIRAFPVLPVQPPAPDAKPPAETTAVPAAELPLKGWAWYPPADDGEHLAIVSDAGQFRIFEAKQPGTGDRPLFVLSEPKQESASAGNPVRGVTFPGEEAAFWVLSNGVLQKYRLGLIPSRGVELLAVGPKLPLGEATQAPQFNNRKDAACLVVRSQTSDGFTAVLLSLRDGSLRWQRQLGVVPAAGAVRQGDGLLVVSRDGGLISIPSTTPAVPGAGVAAPAMWVIEPPPVNVTSPTAVAASADGKTIYTVTQVLVTDDLKPAPKYLIRRVVDGKRVHEGMANAPMLATGPAQLAGPPVVLGDSLILPLTTGFVYRHVPQTGGQNADKLEQGPSWAGNQRVEASVRCYLTPLTGDSFLSTDGTKAVSRWDWPAEGGSTESGKWELREQPAGPGLLLPPAAAGGPARLLLTDASGTVTLYANDRGGKQVRRWRPPAGGLPPGKPTSPLVLLPDAKGKLMVVYTVGEKVVVCLDPDRDMAVWAKPVRPGDDVEGTIVDAPQLLGPGRWGVTDLGGRITILDSATGLPLGAVTVGLPGTVPAAAATPLGTTTVLTPLSDGSAAVLPLPAITVAPEAEQPKEKE